MFYKSNRHSWSVYKALLLLRGPVILFLIFIHISSIITSHDEDCIPTEVNRKPSNIKTLKHRYVSAIPQHFYNNYLDNSVINNDLKSLPIPSTLHFIWCGGHFKYHHYLSVLSSYKLLHPSSIQFHQVSTPSLDGEAYYQFYGDMLRDIPNIELKNIEKITCSSKKDQIYFISHVMNSADGGIFVSLNTIVSNSLNPFRNNKIAYSLNDDYDGILMLTKNSLDGLKHSNGGKLINELKTNVKSSFKCVTNEDYKMSNDVYCVTLKSEIFPADILTTSSDFGKLVRWINYGTKEPLVLKSQAEIVIPKIVHYIWFGNNTLNYFGYMSLLSCIHVLKADAVYVHGDFEPRGEHWNRIKSHEKIHFIYREYPDTIFGNDLHAFLSHGSDILRMDLLLRYGGIYIDWDVLWLNEMPDKLRKYDFVGCFDWPETKPFPEVFNYGVIMGKPGSEYAQFTLESYRHFLDKHWSYSPIHMPYKVYESNPGKIHIDRHFQVICAEYNCHPVWIPGYEKRENTHRNVLKFNWANETLSMHWTYPDPREFKDEATLKKSSGMFADIGKFVLHKAGQQL